jgi:gamma-glutamylcyclotransferase (GGCT)/AIG2-like uncharacterized protein YtfP
VTRPWIVGALGEPALFARLATEMAGTELWSVLLEVVRARARARTPAQVLDQYRRDLFVRPAPVDQRTIVELDGHLLEAARGFEAVELSPVAPLGTCSAIALNDQHRVLSALRGMEVVSDPTNVLALECADRLKRAPLSVVRLASSHRVVRAQPLPKRPGFARHFRIFTLATGGREVADHGLVVGAMIEQVRTMLDALDRLERHGYAFGQRRVDFLTTPAGTAVGDRIASAFTDVPTSRNTLEHGYYSGGVRFLVWVTGPDGAEVPLIDGGAFDWLGRLSANRRLVYVASGMGAQLVPLLFRVQRP